MSISDIFCPYPFVNLMVHAHGVYRPCCRYSQVLHHQGRMLKAPDDTFADAWHSSDMQILRNMFLNGEKAEACSVCWQEEQNGICSMRQQGLSFFRMEHIGNVQPLRLDLYPGNICNLKCRICGHELSTGWFEDKELFTNVKQQVFNNLLGNNVHILKKWLPQLLELGLFGGEPLLSHELYVVLQHIVDIQKSKQMVITLNTNGSVYNERFMEALTHFKKVYFNISIDDIGVRFEYQRKNALWSTLLQNIEKFQNFGSVAQHAIIQYKVCCTISIFNIYYLPELLQFLQDFLPGIEIFFNLLFSPDCFHVKHLPDVFKSQVKHRLLADAMAGNIRQKNYNRTLNDIVNYMMQPGNAKMREEAIARIRSVDTCRKESLAEVFPELWAGLQAAI